MDALIRLTIALLIFLLMVCWEILSPRRERTIGRLKRWPVNLGLALGNMLLMRVSIGGMAYFAAIQTSALGFGLLPALNLPQSLATAIAILLLDFAVYWQHRWSHAWPWLWRLHQVHHSDLDMDASTAVRFHPLEIVISMIYKTLCVALIGADPQAVIIFEVLLNACATFNHSNIYIAAPIDNALRFLWVTPDMHRIHHSTLKCEADSNYGFSISVWDRLLRTYTSRPQQDQVTMPIGLSALRHLKEVRFSKLLWLPFVGRQA